MWARIDERCQDLKFGRSQYFQMLVEWDLRFLPDIHAHKADGKWHLYPETELREGREALRAAEDPVPGLPSPRRRRSK